MIQNKQAEIVEAIKPGKYTILGVGEMMAMTMKAEIEITDVQLKESYAQYRNLVVIVYKQKGKRKLVGKYVKQSDLFLKGWNLGLVTDMEDKTLTPTGTGMMCRTFSGNALINLRGDKEEIKFIIDGAYVYGNKGYVVCKPLGGAGVGEEIPVFVEESKELAPYQAPLKRIMEKQAVA